MSHLSTSTRFALRHTREPIHIPGPNPEQYICIVAQVTTGLREFVLLQDLRHQDQVWLNEISVTGNLYAIDDDDLFHDLYAFLTEKGYITINVTES